MQTGYYHTAWSDIKNSPKWFGKLCLLALIGFIPIFGQIVIAGYVYGWARDIAWNIHAPMPERIFGNEDGKLYSRGFFVWLISFVFSIPAMIFYAASLGASNSSLASALLSLLFLAFSIAALAFAAVGIMRMSIYGRLSPGFQVKQIWKMIKQDVGGLVRIFGMVILVSIIIGIVSVFAVIFVALISGAGALMQLALTGFDMTDPSSLASVAPSIGLFIILMLAVGFLGSVASIFIQVLTARALGYWTRQFDVPQWGGQDDPLPFETGAATTYGAPVATPLQQPTQYGQAAPGQVVQAQAQPGVAPVADTSQAPAWIEQANATAPQPQADPYTGQPSSTSAQASAPYQQPAQYAAPMTPAASGAAPETTSAPAAAPEATVPVAPEAAPAAAPEATPAPAAALEATPAPAAAPEFATQAEAPTPAPVTAPEADAPAEAPIAEAPTAAIDTAAQAPSSADMHHEVNAKPAPRWQKIDLDSLK